MGNGHANVVPYQAFATADGPMVLVAIIDISEDPSLATSQRYYAWYLQDDWKIFRKLTLASYVIEGWTSVIVSLGMS